ncbi:hypothetical protein JB92DRAFT_3130614 [Gautieria morchelliformis]|nr:hypothetical protein JB92DRAFT_3130614 [Gautieria morchelliformis]
MVKKSKSNQIPLEWTSLPHCIDIFHKLYAQGVDPRTLLPPTVPAGADPSPAEETPDTSIEAASAPLFPSDTPNLTTTSVSAAQPISTVRHPSCPSCHHHPGCCFHRGAHAQEETAAKCNNIAMEPVPPVQPPRKQSTWVSKPSKKVCEMDENVISASKTKNK